MHRLAMCMRTARSSSSVLRSFSVTPMLSLRSRSPEVTAGDRVTNLESKVDKVNLATSTMSGSASNASPQGTLTDAQRSVNDLSEQVKTLRGQIRFLGDLLCDSTAWDQNDGRLSSLDAPYRHLFWKGPPTKDEVEAVIVKLKEEYKKAEAQLTAKEQELVLAMAAQQQDLSHPDVSEWTLKYSLREYTIPYKSSDAARQDIESYIKGALCFPSCLKQTILSGCEEYAVNAVRSQTKIFYNAATMGMGKTRLHNELCRGVMKIDCGDHVTTKFVRFTYNEKEEYKNDGTGLTFIKQLLNYHGLAKVEADKTQTLEAGFDIFIKKLSENNAFADRTTKVLCVCVDELHQGHYDGVIQSCLVKDLMSYQDKTLANNEGVRVLFLFNSLTEGLFVEMLTNFFRRTPVNLPGRVPILDPKTIRKLLFKHFPDVERLATKNRFVAQLVDLSCDIPKAAFDGLPQVLQNFTEGGEGEKVVILRELMECTQLVKYKTLLKVQDVAELLVHGALQPDEERLMQAGLAFVTEGEGVRIFPLVLRAWAAHYASIGVKTDLPWFVHMAYDADCVVKEGSEEIADEVLLNIEAAKLFSYKMLKTPFFLDEFYKGGKSSGLTSDPHRSAFQGIRKVTRGEVANFNFDAHLKRGYIVVLPRGEKAIEYLVPFQRTDDEFAVGGVQVKMIKDRPKKTLTDLATKVKKHPAMKGPGKRFPVLCTTYPRAFTWETYGVAFNRSGLETFTREFGKGVFKF